MASKYAAAFTSLLNIPITFTEDVLARIFVGPDGKKCGAGLLALGVSMTDGSNGKDGSLVAKGIVVVTAGGNLAYGDRVVSDANGKAVAASALAIAAGATPVTSTAANGSAIFTGGYPPQFVIGICVSNQASVSGDDVEVLML